MRMAAIYARVSSQQQREENTIASQTASLIEFAQSHDLEVPKEWVFEDEGYSGATLERPGLEHVRDLAAEGQIQVVLAYSPDRLSRKYAYQILLIEEFARHVAEGRSGDRRTIHHHRRPAAYRRRRAAAGLQLQAGDPKRRTARSRHLFAQPLARRHRQKRVSLPAGPHDRVDQARSPPS